MFLDRIDLSLYNFGGDPFETFGLSVQKYGKYSFQYDRKKSEYFYNDLRQIGGGELYNLHNFDFERTTDSGSLKVWLGSLFQVYLNYDRYTKKGNSVTSFDIDRIEFEFDKPISDKSTEATIGLDFHLNRYSFILEERIQDYKNENSLFLPGYADGGVNADYPSSLDSFSLNQPYDFKTNTHTFKFNARPFNSLILSGSAQLSKQDTNLTYSEDAEGINYLDRCYDYAYSGNGNFKREIQLYDFDLTYMLFNKLAVIGAFRYHKFNQDGNLTISKEREDMALKYNNMDFEGGLQYQFSPKLALTLGYRNETRKLDGAETVTYEEETQKNGLFGNLKWDASQAIHLTADYQRSDYEDPYTLISPTSSDRFRLTTKMKFGRFNISGSYLLNTTKSEVDSDRWKSTKNQFDLRAGYQGSKIKLVAGYSLIDVKRSGNRNVEYPPYWTGPGGSFLWKIAYKGKSSIFNASLSFNLDEKLKIGGYGNIYTNAGSWRISQTTVKGYLEYAFNNGMISRVGYRFIDFKEKDSGYNNYKANIFELSFGYRW
ncbi:MAG: hypothetical protein V1897_18855 [Pseudomonadota bacterium]